MTVEYRCRSPVSETETPRERYVTSKQSVHSQPCPRNDYFSDCAAARSYSLRRPPCICTSRTRTHYGLAGQAGGVLDYLETCTVLHLHEHSCLLVGQYRSRTVQCVLLHECFLCYVASTVRVRQLSLCPPRASFSSRGTKRRKGTRPRYCRKVTMS